MLDLLTREATVADDDEVVRHRREALRRFMAERRLRAHPWATRAGVSSGSLYAFLKEETDALSLPVLQKLAAVENVSVGVLLGEAEEAGGASAAITHALRGDRIVPLNRTSKRRVPIPATASSDQLRVAEVQAGSSGVLRSGALLYWTEQAGRPDEHVGSLCIVDTGEAGLLLADLRRGFAPGRYLLVTTSGEVVEGAEVRAAWPLEWVRP